MLMNTEFKDADIDRSDIGTFYLQEGGLKKIVVLIEPLIFEAEKRQGEYWSKMVVESTKDAREQVLQKLKDDNFSETRGWSMNVCADIEQALKEE